ncbi:ComF family protein [Croceibacterium salegens]|uniref:ComF family protein n=1 Tax=Croceibacterium salegens TaxID=1737568 RepID=UPI002E25BC20
MLREALRPVVDLVYPPRCPLCGAGLAAQDGLCAYCWAELAIPGEPSCAKYQRPFGDGVPVGAICLPCLGDPPKHDGIAAGTLYNEASRKLVLAFKHGRRIALARLLAGLMAARLPPIEGQWMVVPVSLHRWRLWRRGFN